MTEVSLNLTPRTLVVFVDETGNEDYSDPRNPTFGRGGCAVLGSDYVRLIKKPWRKLKREALGGASKHFHATDFEQSRPTKLRITRISRFLRRPFWRFAAMSDDRTELPGEIDGHRAISLVTINFIRKLVATYPGISTVALVFEASGRGDELVKRDFDLANMNVFNAHGQLVIVDGYFMDKKAMEAGLEVADLVAHTAGRQRRHELAGKGGRAKDFEAMYWHSPIPPAFMSIDSVQFTKLVPENSN
ncbi:MAG: DUF3800 domain-containing protein [Hyphomicrobiales bacterium]